MRTSRVESSRQREHGFTMLELLIVISIIALAVGLIAPNLALTERSAFKADVRRAVATLTYARRVAIVKATPMTAQFSTIAVNDDTELDEQVPAYDSNLHWTGEGITLGFQGEFDPEPEQKATVPVTFFPQGGSSGGTLHFTLDEQEAWIYIDAITGRISPSYDGEDVRDAAS